MANRFVIVVDQPSASSRQAVTTFIKETGVAWWHWFQDCWLLVDRGGRDAEWWVEAVRSKVANQSVLVIEVPGSAAADWAVFCTPDAQKWLLGSWNNA